MVVLCLGLFLCILFEKWAVIPGLGRKKKKITAFFHLQRTGQIYSGQITNMTVIPSAICSLCPLCNAWELLTAIRGSWRSVYQSGLARLRLVELISRDKKRNYTHSSVWNSTPYTIVQKAFGWTVLSYRESH